MKSIDVWSKEPEWTTRGTPEPTAYSQDKDRYGEAFI